VVDSNEPLASATGAEFQAEWSADWRPVVKRTDIDVVIVATPNAFLAPIAIEALRARKHVLVEKPMGRNLSEAREISDAAAGAGRLLKVGFNHRYHPALKAARECVASGAIGPVINIRAVYGHGGRPGYEREWRGNQALAGGGEATDQGVHVFDLIRWFAGMPSEVFAYTQTAIWPIAPLEDNALGLFRFDSGAVASFHTSWTEWKNRFTFDVHGERGSVEVRGLGKSYGVETLVTIARNVEGGLPTVARREFAEPDESWRLEWLDFRTAIGAGTPYMGGPRDGVAAMTMLDAVYRSAATGQRVPVTP
jgi:predicted dehydrogenase